MKYLLLCLVLLLSACSTTVPVTAKFPAPPGILAQESCPVLKKLDTNPKLSDVSKTVTDNYSEYYACSYKLEAWQKWYTEQKIIFERLK